MPMKYLILVFLFFMAISCNHIDDSIKIIGWGDSMMKGSGGDKSILEILTEELKVAHENFAIGGIGSNSVAVLQGGIPMQLVLKNQEIKKLGPTEIIYYNIEPINFQTEQFRKGFIDSIEGKIERLSEKENNRKTIGYTVTPKDINTSIKVKDTVVFRFEDAIRYNNEWTIIWAGRNDKKSGDHVFRTRDNIQAMIDHLGKNAREHALVLSICNGIADNEFKGSIPHTEIVRLNSVLKETFGDRFVDVRSYMVNTAIYDMGMIPTEQDLEDIKKDCIPRSLLKDNVHFNTLGYEATGKYLAKVIKEKKWIIQK